MNRRPPPAKKVPTRRPTQVPREVRIIGGQWKRTKLPVADKPGLRPTPDRVRETLFNWLGQDLTGWRCVDAFAGTGALGLEAASRGAADVLVVEQDAQLVDQLRAIQAKLGAAAVKVERGNGLSVLGRLAPGSTELIFLDPPFDAGLYEKALAAAAQALSAEGLIYLEAPVAWDDAALAPYGLAAVRHLKAGAVHAHLLRRAA
ncbi:16S rRNA (guanine(966)-N(2))-methyltransferase RsmD [Ramlibacter sp. WS9]|uniref:16S rRNA (guanine(966)-N(2))-methyltransferase RsmD n=1 Tax=Ramlibacter sp. WS9 TaxID=1882741 RepID=UPI0011436CC8|nr:16S rRNA (guanine(966)-N(2))-methyltransferase RsmD [Ramlibacter sp. WS9]ROZ79702.1 16S rRNA (guanine(966)-N(2))-methyltransferase RsmD [Ramlibacter sp. WS9]